MVFKYLSHRARMICPLYTSFRMREDLVKQATDSQSDAKAAKHEMSKSHNREPRRLTSSFSSGPKNDLEFDMLSGSCVWLSPSSVWGVLPTPSRVPRMGVIASQLGIPRGILPNIRGPFSCNACECCCLVVIGARCFREWWYDGRTRSF